VADLRASSLEGILGSFRDVARVLDLAVEGEVLGSELRARIAAVSERTLKLQPVSVVGLEWIDPIFNMGNWGPELVALAGGRTLLGTPGEFSTSIEWERLREADPEVLLIAPCGFPIERTLREMHLLEAQPGWRDLRAVRAGRVAVADGNRYFNRSGPSVVDSIEMLAAIFHPSEFAPRHEETCWRYYPPR
jgi:iron complex transport system substrate-binding protein